MRGSIVKRGRDSWSVVVDLGMVNGRRKQKWFTVKGTRKDAEAERIRQLSSLQDGTFVDNTKMTVPEYLDYWLENHAKSAVSKKTFERFSEMIHNHLAPAFPMPLQKLRPVDVQTFFTKAEKSGRKDGKGGVSRQTIKHFYRLLKSSFKQAVRLQILKVNPLDAVTPPRVEKTEHRVLDVDGVLALLERAERSQIYPALLIAALTGMRRGEVCALRWQDVDLMKGQISVCRTLEQTAESLTFKEPKTKKSRRTIAMIPMLVSGLKSHKAEQAKIRLMMGTGYQDNGLIFCRMDGSPYPPNSLTTSYRSLIRSTHFKGLRLHDLRHSFATIHLQLGTPTKVISETLGHSNIGITLDTYSHVTPNMQDDAAARMQAAFQTAKDGR